MTVEIFCLTLKFSEFACRILVFQLLMSSFLRGCRGDGISIPVPIPMGIPIGIRISTADVVFCGTFFSLMLAVPLVDCLHLHFIVLLCMFRNGTGVEITQWEFHGNGNKI